MVDSSLGEVARQLEVAFEARRADREVQVIPGPVHRLLEQVLAGAPADVVIGPGGLPTDAHHERGLVVDTVQVASSQVAIVMPQSVASSRPAEARDLVGLRIVIPEAGHPLGVQARELLVDTDADDPRRLVADVVSVEPDGPAVVSRVLGGGVDAGVALLPDVLAARGVRGSALAGVEWTMPVQAALFSPRADAFVEFLADDEARQILRDAGFETP